MKSLPNLLIASLLLFLISASVTVYSQQLPTNEKAELYKVHNDLYFTRLFAESLNDSIIQRNLQNSITTIINANLDTNEILYNKAFSEYYYLQGLLNFNTKKDFEATLYLNASKYYNKKTTEILKSDKYENDTLSISNCFIEESVLHVIDRSIAGLKENILRRRIEQLFIEKRDIKTKIFEIEYIYYKLSNNVYYSVDTTLKKIYLFSKADYYREIANVDSAIYYFNQLNFNKKLAKKNIEFYGKPEIQDDSNNNYITHIYKKPVFFEYEYMSIPDIYILNIYPLRSDYDSLKNKIFNLNNNGLRIIQVEIIEKSPFSVLATKAPERIKELTSIPSTTLKYDIPSSLLNPSINKTLGSFNSQLSDGLKKEGYNENKKSYYSYRNGFALITQLEKIYSDGKPLEEPERFDLGRDKTIKTFKDFLRVLFMGNKGYYRFMIFVVTDQNIKMDNNNKISFSDANEILEDGAGELPYSILNIKMTNNHIAKAFVYIFEKNDIYQTPILVKLSNNSAEYNRNIETVKKITK